MKLRAVRLSEVGHFGTGVALEGLSGGFDVLAGPNEMGKSTIFRAIEALFEEEHTGANKVLRELAPAAGGAPLVEVDFDADGQLWRIRKRYLAQKSAVLTDLASGAVLRGADAENKFAALRGGRLDRAGLLGLMWVGQQKSVELPEGEVEIAKGIGRLIEDEIAEAGGGGGARRVREHVLLALKGLVSPKDRIPRAGKPYKAAIDARDRAKAGLESAQAAAQQAAQRLRDLEAARAKADALRSPEAAAARTATLADLRQRHAAVVRAEEEFRLATQVVEAREAQHQQARARHDRLAKDIAEAQRLREFLQSAVEIKARTSNDVAALTDRLAKLLPARSDARAQAATVQTGLEAHDRYQRAQMLSRHVDELSQRLSSATATAARIAEIDAALANDPMTDGAWRDVQRASADADRWEARVAAALPRVRIDYAEGAAGRIRLAGSPVMASGELALSETLVLDIAGVGRVTVSAPAAVTEAGESPSTSLATARAKLQTLLTRLGVADVPAAEGRQTVRAKLVLERENLSARLKADVPDGIAELSRRHATAIAEANEPGAKDAAPPATRSALQAQLDAARTQIAKLDADEAIAQASLLDATRHEAKAAAEHASAAARLAHLDDRLPPAAAAADALAVAAAEVQTMAAQLQSAIRDRGAWKAGIPEAAARAALDRDLVAAERASHEAEQALQQLAIDIKGLESALERDRHDGVEARVVELQERLAAAEARVAAFESEVRELELLERLLGEQDRSRRSTELAPVIERLQMLARDVLPGATFELGDKLRVSGIVRAGQSLSPARLSGGTQEQIAVLVRLAYGRLLADRDAALPLVLDDALVYADDQRFSAMIKLLADASAHHQVIMLTCQALRMSALGPQTGTLPRMTLVGLTPWRPS